MSSTSLLLFSISCAIFAVNIQVEGKNENPGRLLSCWTEKLKYENFKIDVYFSSRNHKDQILQQGSNFGPNHIDFDPRRKTAVIVHGFMSHGQDRTINKLKNALLEWQDINVIVIGWQRGCWNPLLYHQAAANTEFAALTLRELFSKLKEFFGKYNIGVEEWGGLHFIGFSLGAHVVGQAAELLKREDNLLVDRVTGLDPAEPCFENPKSPLRLSRTNARFVDVIHSDVAYSKNKAFGILEPIGHADFYLNGGTKQPGCDSLLSKRILNYLQLSQHALSNGGCSHNRALDVFIDTIVQTISGKCKFWAHPWNIDYQSKETEQILGNKCDDTTCVEMGINADNYKYSENNGMYYVKTTRRSPFCQLV